MPLFPRRPRRHRRRKPDDTIQYHARLGQEALDDGDAATALEHFTRLVDLHVERHGPTDYETLVWKAFAAKAHAALGQVAEAVEVQRVVIADRTATLGPDDPATLSTRGQLGQTLTRNGRPEEGLEVQEALYLDKERVLGERHPSTLDTLGNIAESLLLAQRTDEAVLAYETLLHRRLDVLGADHPLVTQTRSNLAIAQARHYGTDPRGIDVLVANLEENIRQHGADSEVVLTARGYLAEQHLRLGDSHAALTVLTPLIEDRRNLLGEGHPDTLRSERMAIEAIDLIGDSVCALVELDDLVTRLVVAFGPTDPATSHARLLRLQIAADLGRLQPADVAAFADEVAGQFEPGHEVHEILRELAELVADDGPDGEGP